jgi:glyoxylase-like metal-dependent hydrolase (beta-lactamase superfamily II)
VDIREIVPGAWSATQPEARRFNDCNSLIVEAEQFVIVVDAQENADDVRQIIAFANVLINKPVRYLVNTHWHSDHTQGNALYADEYGDELVIIGHSTHTEDITGQAADYLNDRVADIRKRLPDARRQLESGRRDDGSTMSYDELNELSARVEAAEAWVAEQEKVRFVGPRRTVDGPDITTLGAASFVIRPFRGHTRGDLVVHFPELGIAATGDLVDAMPYAGHGFPAEWLSALDEIRSLGAKTYVPGHGGVLHDNSLIDKLRAYFESLISQVEALYTAGKTPAEIEATVDLGDSRAALAGDDAAAGRFFDRVQAEAIQRTIDELSPRD